MCVRLHFETSERTVLISQTTPDAHPPTPLPCRWPALVTLATLAKFLIAWRRLCDVVLFRSSCLFERTLSAVCALPEHQCRRKYNVYSSVSTSQTCTCIVLKSGWNTSSLVLLSFPLTSDAPSRWTALITLPSVPKFQLV